MIRLESNKSFLFYMFPFKSYICNPDIFNIGVDFDGTAASVKKTGIYYFAYHLMLRRAKEIVNAGLVVNNNISNIIFESITKAGSQTVNLQSSGFVKFVVGDSVMICVQSRSENNTSEILQDSSLSIRFHNSLPSTPGFSFSLKDSKLFSSLIEKKLGPWFTKRYGEFSSSRAFQQDGSSFLVPFSGIYMICANILVDNLSSQKIRTTLYVFNDNHALTQTFVSLNPTQVSTLVAYQMFNLKFGSTLYLEIQSSGKQLQILESSTWSVVYIRDSTNLFNGFIYQLNDNKQIILGEDYSYLSKWIGSNSTGFYEQHLTTLLLDLQSFNTEITSFFYTIVNIKFRLETHNKVNASFLKIFLYSASGKTYTYHTFTGNLDNEALDKDFSLTLNGAFEISKARPLSVTLKGPLNATVYVLNTSTFSVMEVPQSYPGMYARLSASRNILTNAYTIPVTWVKSGGLGMYDFDNDFDGKTGYYYAPSTGVYLVTANIVVNFAGSQVVALFSKNEEKIVENGLYVVQYVPDIKSTINIGGFIDLQKDDKVALYLKAASDEDWSIQKAGLSMAYLGVSPAYFHAKLSTIIRSRKPSYPFYGWKVLRGSIKLDEDTYFRAPFAGVYFIITNIIMRQTTPNKIGAYFKLSVVKNEQMIPGLYSMRERQKENNNGQIIKDFTLFISGSFYAEKGDSITINLETGLSDSYDITMESSWGITFISSIENAIGVSSVLETSKNFIRTKPWQLFGNFKFRDYFSEGLYISNRINLEEKSSVKIKLQGIYLISANIELANSQDQEQQYQVSFVVNGFEGDDNGLLVWQASKWSSLTINVVGALLLNNGDVLTLRLIASYVGVIAKQVGLSVVAIPEVNEATSFTAYLEVKCLVTQKIGLPILC